MVQRRSSSKVTNKTKLELKSCQRQIIFSFIPPPFFQLRMNLCRQRAKQNCLKHTTQHPKTKIFKKTKETTGKLIHLAVNKYLPTRTPQQQQKRKS